MNKITKLALGLSYPQDKISALLELINVTPNSVIATEKLLGIYEQPKLPSKVKTKEGQIRVMKSIDYWREVVSYSYLQNKRIGAYYPKEVNEKQLNDNNWESLKCSSSTENCHYLYFNSSEKEERQTECTFEQWLSCENITPQRQFENIYEE